MKFTSSALLVAAAVGVSAHPSPHAHLHNVARDFVVANKPVSVAPTSVASAPSATGTAATGSKVPFCSGKGKRATLADISYKGNVGTASNYGCNIMEVDSSISSLYDYTATFTNSRSEAQECVCWNKIGPDGGINGFFKNNHAMQFTLPASGKAVIAVDENSQGGCACGVGSVPLTSFGQFAGTWLEFDMCSGTNNKWSGADASALVAAANGLDIPALKVCGAGTCSEIFAGGKGDNAYVGGMEAADGVGLNLAPGKVRLEVTVG